MHQLIIKFIRIIMIQSRKEKYGLFNVENTLLVGRAQAI